MYPVHVIDIYSDANGKIQDVLFTEFGLPKISICCIIKLCIIGFQNGKKDIHISAAVNVLPGIDVNFRLHIA